MQNNASKLKTFLSFSIEQWPVTAMELEQKWNVNPRCLGAWRGVEVGRGLGTEVWGGRLHTTSSHHPPVPPEPLGHFWWLLTSPFEHHLTAPHALMVF